MDQARKLWISRELWIKDNEMHVEFHDITYVHVSWVSHNNSVECSAQMCRTMDYYNLGIRRETYVYGISLRAIGVR